MDQLTKLRQDIKALKNPEKAAVCQRFFKTGKGEYGEGDMFLGLTVPQCREIVKNYKTLPFIELKKLIRSKYHEERLIALLILVKQFEAVYVNRNLRKQKQIYGFYLANYMYINNWDLVDLTADKIVGKYLITYPKKRKVLRRLARNENVWKRRIAIMATFAFIKWEGSYEDTFEIAEILLHDKHDLIHKAVGWMLREVGKRISQEKEEEFLKKHYKDMPRTALRYAIEHFEEEKRKAYLEGKYSPDLHKLFK